MEKLLGYRKRNPTNISVIRFVERNLARKHTEARPYVSRKNIPIQQISTPDLAERAVYSSGSAGCCHGENRFGVDVLH